MGSEHSTLSSSSSPSSANPISYRCVSSRPNYNTELLKRLPLLHGLNSAHSASELTSAINEIIEIDVPSYRCEELRDLLLEKRADILLEIEQEEEEDDEEETVQQNMKNHAEFANNLPTNKSDKTENNLRKTTNLLVASIGNLLLWFIPEGGTEFEVGQQICSTPQVVSFVVKLLSLFRNLHPHTVGILADCVCCITAGNADGRRLFSESNATPSGTTTSQVLVGALEYSVKLLRGYHDCTETSPSKKNSTTNNNIASLPDVIETVQLLCGAIGNITFRNHVAKEMFASIPDCIPSLIEALEVVCHHQHQTAQLHEDDLISHTIQFIATAIANIATNPTAKEILSSKNENFAKILLSSFSCAMTPESVGWIASAIHNITRENTEQGKRFFSSKEALEIIFRVLVEKATTPESCQWVCTCIYNILLENSHSEGVKSLLMLHHRDEGTIHKMESIFFHVLHFYSVVKSLLICLNDRTKNSPDCVLSVCRTLHYILLIGLEHDVFSKCELPKNRENKIDVRGYYDQDDYEEGKDESTTTNTTNKSPQKRKQTLQHQSILTSPRRTYESIHDEYDEVSSPVSVVATFAKNDLQEDASAQSLTSLLSSPLCVMAFVSAIKNAKDDSRAADHVWSLLFFVLNENKPTSVEAFGSSYFLRRVEGLTDETEKDKEGSGGSKEFNKIYKHSIGDDDDNDDDTVTSSSRKNNKVYHQKESEDYINVVKILNEEIERKKGKNVLAQAELQILDWTKMKIF